MMLAAVLLHRWASTHWVDIFYLGGPGIGLMLAVCLMTGYLFGNGAIMAGWKLIYHTAAMPPFGDNNGSPETSEKERRERPNERG